METKFSYQIKRVANTKHYYRIEWFEGARSAWTIFCPFRTKKEAEAYGEHVVNDWKAYDEKQKGEGE